MLKHQVEMCCILEEHQDCSFVKFKLETKSVLQILLPAMEMMDLQVY